MARFILLATFTQERPELSPLPPLLLPPLVGVEDGVEEDEDEDEDGDDCCLTASFSSAGGLDVLLWLPEPWLA